MYSIISTGGEWHSRENEMSLLFLIYKIDLYMHMIVSYTYLYGFLLDRYVHVFIDVGHFTSFTYFHAETLK